VYTRLRVRDTARQRAARVPTVVGLIDVAPLYRRQLSADHMQHYPSAVAASFARDPFGGAPRRFLRLAVYRYRFTDAATRAQTGAW